MMSLREWWAQPADYAWTVQYTQAHPLLRVTRVAIGLYCWIYGIVCVLALTTPLMTQNPNGRTTVTFFAVTTVVVGCAWVRGPWPPFAWSLAFVAYAELGVTSILFALDAPSIGLLCAALLGVIGTYVAAFHDAKIFLAHQVWSLATCTVLYVLALEQPGISVTEVTAYLIVVVLVLVSSPVLTQAFLILLRRDAAVAHFDPLTGLRNRRGLESAIAGLTADPVGVAVLVADLDNFKSVNDNHGHSYGDDVLRRTAEILTSTFPAPAVTARTGGEEFVVVNAGSLRPTTVAAEELRRTIPQCNVKGHTTTSIGIHYRSHTKRTVGAILDELLDCADSAMYEAKRRGGDAVVIDIDDGVDNNNHGVDDNNHGVDDNDDDGARFTA